MVGQFGVNGMDASTRPGATRSAIGLKYSRPGVWGRRTSKGPVSIADAGLVGIHHSVREVRTLIQGHIRRGYRHDCVCTCAEGGVEQFSVLWRAHYCGDGYGSVISSHRHHNDRAEGEEIDCLAAGHACTREGRDFQAGKAFSDAGCDVFQSLRAPVRIGWERG